MVKKLDGVMLLIPTPLNEDLSLKEESVTKVVNWGVDQGAIGVWADGAMAEVTQIDEEVRKRMHEVVVEACKAKGVFCGVGCYGINPFQCIRLVKHAEEIGADLAWMPMRSIASDDGIYQFYKMVHDNTKSPLGIYNTTAFKVYLRPELIARIASLERVAFMKDVYENFSHACGLYNLGVYEKINVFPDHMVVLQLMLGAAGLLAPMQLLKRTVDIYNTYKKDGFEKALKLELEMHAAFNHNHSLIHTQAFGATATTPPGGLGKTRMGAVADVDMGPPMLPGLPATEDELNQIGELKKAGKEIPI